MSLNISSQIKKTCLLMKKIHKHLFQFFFEPSSVAAQFKIHNFNVSIDQFMFFSVEVPQQLQPKIQRTLSFTLSLSRLSAYGKVKEFISNSASKQNAKFAENNDK